MCIMFRPSRRFAPRTPQAGEVLCDSPLPSGLKCTMVIRLLPWVWESISLLDNQQFCRLKVQRKDRLRGRRRGREKRTLGCDPIRKTAMLRKNEMLGLGPGQSDLSNPGALCKFQRMRNHSG